ncbi:MAG: methylated-DNA--[protein]-cysteine S-methyltransferase [Methanobacterium sp.]|nr:methylated-DNA--[protein]-cysteine S-methyltransferase [Methanobacterium sp.]
MIFLKSTVNVVIISNYQINGLFFSIGISSITGKIVKISLPHQDETKAMKQISDEYPNYEVSEKYEDLVKKITPLYAGEDEKIDLKILDLEVRESNESPIKTAFMRDVLVETSKISHGKVGTYKSLAEKLGTHAYRAVGTALRKNPFPLIIPCHRVVRSDLTIGKYAGGSEMKKELLKREGVTIKGDKVIIKNIF